MMRNVNESSPAVFYSARWRHSLGCILPLPAERMR